MYATYVPSSNTATNGVSLGAAGQDVRVYRVIFGLPVDGAYVALFNSATAVGGATANLAAKIVQPTAAAGKDWVRMYDFGPEGLPLDGGNVQTDNTMNVTVIWDFAPVND